VPQCPHPCARTETSCARHRRDRRVAPVAAAVGKQDRHHVPTRKPCALAVVIVATCDALCVCVIATPANAALLARFVGSENLAAHRRIVKSFELARSQPARTRPPTQLAMSRPVQYRLFVCR